MDDPIQIIITIVGSVLASSGFWAIIMKRSERKDARTKMLLGLSHDRIIALGMQYVTRGYVLQDEYDDLYSYLWEPYHELGGNGSAERVINEVNKLKIYKTHADAQKNENTR